MLDKEILKKKSKDKKEECNDGLENKNIEDGKEECNWIENKKKKKKKKIVIEGKGKNEITDDFSNQIIQNTDYSSTLEKKSQDQI